MTFLERYDNESTWHGKASIMEIYHLAMCHRMKLLIINWTLTDTSKYFGVSVGLVSENLRIAQEINNNPDILKCESRQSALKRINRKG
jgi:hypothetical protein